MKLKKFKYVKNTDVVAIQFFTDKVSKFPKGIIEKVWADYDRESFCRNLKDAGPGALAEEYVIEGWNTYLKDGDWIVIADSGKGYPRIIKDDVFKREYKTKSERK